MLRASGFTIAFDGPDGSGKSTQCRALAQRLEGAGIVPQIMPLFRHDAVEKMLDDLDSKLDVPDVGSRYAVIAKILARQQWLVQPILSMGGTVLLDKYAITFYANEMVRGADPHELNAMLSWVTPPDLAFFLDLEPEASLERKNGIVGFREAGLNLARYQGEPVDFNRWASGAYPQHFLEECYVSFQQSLREKLLEIVGQVRKEESAFGKRVVALDATESEDEIAARIWKTLCAELTDEPGY